MGLFSGSFYSENLKMNTYLRIIFPDESNDVTPAVIGEPSLLYLLHGLSGNSEEWIRFSKLEYYAKKYNLIMILPEVSRSFYCDYPGGQRFFTYVADELPELAASWLKLPKERSKTFSSLWTFMGGRFWKRFAFHSWRSLVAKSTFESA